MPRQGYTILSYAFLFEQLDGPLFKWLVYELEDVQHPLYLLAERLAKAKSEAERIKICQSVNKQELNLLVAKFRLFLAIESLREHQAYEDDLVIKSLLQQEVGPELLRFIRLAKSRIDKKQAKKSQDFHFLYEWNNWEQYYLTRFLPKDRNAQNLTPERMKLWTEGLELELIHLGTHYLILPSSNAQINQLLDWLSRQEASLDTKPALYLFQNLRQLWYHLPDHGVVKPELEKEVLKALYAAKDSLHEDYFANLYVMVLNFFIRKAQCFSQYEDYERLYTLYEWGLVQGVFPMNRQFLLSISNTLLSLAELSEASQKEQWLGRCEEFIANYHQSLPKAEQAQCRAYIKTHINFLKGNFDAVIIPASTDQLEDPHYSLLSFFLSLQLWYEKGDYDWVRALINKKKKATTEWKRLGPKAKRMLSIRLELFSKLLKAKSHEKLSQLEASIKKPRPLEGRVWFLQKLAQKRQWINSE
ncbi:MAG: hypothetical protein AAF927_08320 [Bacteroidota bacterium]